MTDWQKQAQEKRDSVNALIPKDWRLKSPVPSIEQQKDVTGKYIEQYLTSREIEITETDAVNIVKHTSSGEWKAREVTEAFCHRAALAHQLVCMTLSGRSRRNADVSQKVNCLHEIFFDLALDQAQQLDDYYAENKKPIGPLHGLPISLKDQFHIKGVETHMGYVGWIGTFQGKKDTGKEKVFESEMVKELRSMGAVFYCKTSVPHSLMCGETTNNIIGYTFNPKNRNLAAGGSSGGEGALIGLKGSPLGFGTDIGGSVRIPAVFNGLYGLRTSGGRLPYEGMANSMDGQNTILSTVGPLSTSVGGLRLAMKSILSQEPWLHDPLVHELPWRDEHEEEILEKVRTGSGGAGRLVFGILRHDGTVLPQPPVRRALEMVVRALEKVGHKVVEWEPPSHTRGAKIGLETWFYDGGKDIHDSLGLSGEPIMPQVASTYGKGPTAQVNASKIAEVNVQKREYQKEYMEYWNDTKSLTGTGRPVDAFIMPLAPYASPLHGKYKYYAYSTIINLLDYTAAVVPVTQADKTIDVADPHFKPMSDLDNETNELYDAEIYDGAHVGVQLVGRRLQEEKVTALLEVVSEALAKDAGVVPVL
ncbi:MAG: Acetamidase [Chaenotheca gracillima]|nr:MAG: Acetamidase [Chaenotheca gracillima]